MNDRHTSLRRWTAVEIQRLELLLDGGNTYEVIGKEMGRSTTSVKLKAQRLKRECTEYGDTHRKEKYALNDIFLRQLMKTITKPKVLDVYAGPVSYYINKNLKVIANDIKYGGDYKLDSLELLVKFRKKTFDIVDLDPFGSAFHCFDLAIQIANYGLIITYGEYGHRRWNRSDYVKPRYGIKTFKDFTPENMSKYVIDRALIFNKKLTPILIGDFKDIIRVYYIVESIKEHTTFGKSYFPKSH